MEPVFLLVGRNAVAEQLVGALAGDPVVAPVERRAAAGTTRRRMAAAMRVAADRMAPVEPAPAPRPAGY